MPRYHDERNPLNRSYVLLLGKATEPPAAPSTLGFGGLAPMLVLKVD